MAPTTSIEPSLDIAVETPNSDPAFIPSITRDFVASRTGSNGVGAFVGPTADAVAVGDRDDGVLFVPPVKSIDADSVLVVFVLL